MKNMSGKNLSLSQKSSNLTQKQAKDSEIELTPLWEIYEDVEKSVMERDTKPKYPTGLKELDEIVWGLHKKQITVIGGRPSAGKSAFALHLGKKLAELKCRVGIFSLEMTKEQYVERLLCSVCGINNMKLLHGNESAKERVKKNRDFFNSWLEEAELLIDDKYGFHFDNVVKVIEQINPPFDFIFIDYIQMVSTQGYYNKLQAIEEYLRKMKELTNILDIGVIVLSQRNKEGALKWTGMLRETADTVMKVEWDREKDDYSIIVDKQRHGGIGKINVNFIPQNFKFEDMTEIEVPF